MSTTDDASRPLEELLTPDLALELLSGYGLAGHADGRPEVLSGGVSGIVIASGDVVVKQALGKLAVRGEWFAPLGRIADEADALRIAANVIPGQAPTVLHFDPDRDVMVIERAPRDWEDLRTRFLRGDIDPGVGAALGELLARWHTGTATADNLARFGDRAGFRALRVEPFYLTAAERAPRVGQAISDLIAAMDALQVTLVHGDFSPKNILAGGPHDYWAIDFETTHAGDPAFDVAFMLHHVILKSIHQPAHADALDDLAHSFVAAYTQEIEPLLRPNPSHVMAHVAALMLARTIGKSPAPYLDEGERDRAQALAEDLLLADIETLDQILDERDRVIA